MAGGRGRGAQLAGRRGDGALARPAPALRPLRRARQARLRRSPPRVAPPAPPQRHLLRRGRGRTAPRPPGRGRAPALHGRAAAGGRDAPPAPRSPSTPRPRRRAPSARSRPAATSASWCSARPPWPEHAICPKAPLALAREGTVVIVGGTSGFGLAAARRAGRGRRAAPRAAVAPRRGDARRGRGGARPRRPGRERHGPELRRHRPRSALPGRWTLCAPPRRPSAAWSTPPRSWRTAPPLRSTRAAPRACWPPS